MAIKFAVGVKEKQDRLPTLYRLPKRHKGPYKTRFIANSSSCITKLKCKENRTSSLSTYTFSTFYITLPHNLIKDKLTDLLERSFTPEGSLYWACNEKTCFFISDKYNKNYTLWTC